MFNAPMGGLSGAMREMTPEEKAEREKWLKKATEIYAAIAGWMFINDGRFQNKNDWREALLQHIRVVMELEYGEGRVFGYTFEQLRQIVDYIRVENPQVLNQITKSL